MKKNQYILQKEVVQEKGSLVIELENIEIIGKHFLEIKNPTQSRNLNIVQLANSSLFLKISFLEKLETDKVANQVKKTKNNKLKLIINIWQIGENSQSEVQVFGEIDKIVEIQIVVWQMANDCQVNINSAFLVKNNLDLLAKIIIKGQNCQASFQNHNLILGEKIQNKISPFLEVYQLPKKCVHNTTTSFIDRQLQEYLQTRGISRENGQKMIAKNFLDDFKTKM